MAQFFIAPELDLASIYDEVSAVESEYQNGKDNNC